MLLYDLAPGMNPRRVRIFLAEKGVSIPTQVMDPQTRTYQGEAFRRLNPMGALPVLVLDSGEAISESIAICRYLEALYPTPNLMGEGALETARIEMWTRRLELGLVADIVEQFRHLSPYWEGRLEQDAKRGRVAREAALRQMVALDAHLGNDAFAAGPRYTIADIVAQCGLLVAKATGLPIPGELARLKAWWDGVTARPSARA
jgi:glutathione S-transferase